jgi:RHS repeat-associated protein
MKIIKRLFVLIILALSFLPLSSDAVLNITGPISITFSPQSELDGYLFGLTSIIDSSQSTLEIALYGFDDFNVYNALKRASERGVQIRMLSESAATDRKESSGTLSHQLEAIGMDVRYVNKTLHHKFLIADNSFLVTSSGNWNEDASSVYDENTLWIKDPALVLRYRSEFETLWQNSREFGQTFAFSTGNPTPESLLAQIGDHPGRDACFTSANYRTYISDTYGPTFAKISGSQVVAGKIVELISQATQSIDIAANHMRSRPIAEALIAKKRQYPGMDIHVYLDDQEYISEEYNQVQTAEREAELAKATTPGEIRDIMEKDFYYSYELINAGIDVRFKTYSYKWHPDTSPLMHHKYAIFDNRIVATGSYNYSYNSETESMENMLVIDDTFSSETVTAFRNNFKSIWNTGRVEGYYNDLLAYINSCTRYIPVLYPSMALTYSEVRSLKRTIENVCPEVMGSFFKDYHQFFASFLKGLQFNYDENQRVVSVRDAEDQSFIINYTYNEQNIVTSVLIQSSDNLLSQADYSYDGNGNPTGLLSPEFNVNFIYDNNNQLKALNAGLGTHTWSVEANDSGFWGSYSTPFYANYLNVQLNQQRTPSIATDADGRILYWQYDNDYNYASISSTDRTINYSLYDRNRDWRISANDGESIHYQQPNINEFNITTSGTVQADLHYTVAKQQDKNTLTTIDIVSNHVISGTGKKASVKYVFNGYDRVIEAGNVRITRQPFSENITSITCNGIVETRAYNDWEELTSQRVTFNEQIYYGAQYQYDGLHRIKFVSENILGVIATYDYTYDRAGRLATVSKNGTIVEQYAYDPFGNRSAGIYLDLTENYVYNGANRLLKKTWQLPDSLRKAEYFYNNSGQLRYTAYETVKDGSQWLTKERNYDYDIFGNLKSVAWASQKHECKYDPYDRLIGRIQNGNLASGYIYGLDSMPLAELNQNGRIINVYLYADGYTPIAMQKAGTEYYFISDIRGSVRMIVKSDTGEIRQQISYDSFGKVLEDSNPGYTSFGFAGGFYDYRTELVRFGARDYQPETGRWTNEDPIGFQGGDVNFYAYVRNDPVNYTDPTGLLESGGGWSLGDPVDALTRAGSNPDWSTVRSRYWKNEALKNPGKYSQSNLERMQKGLAPRHAVYGVSKELHHTKGRDIPNPHNAKNLKPLWPWQHAKVDPSRTYTGPQPK